jgi:hypothetical protein
MVRDDYVWINPAFRAPVMFPLFVQSFDHGGGKRGPVIAATSPHLMNDKHSLSVTK